ncbi:alpha/beta hydrolase domain-containing protein [Massilia soli]|nr:alpha/beta hydrolase domain-containing protein [Massilia soli]
MRCLSLLAPLLALASCASQPSARIGTLEIVARAPAYGGTVFEGGGAYEAVTAVAHLASGDAEVLVLQPTDALKKSGVLLIEAAGADGRLLARMANDGDARHERADSAGNGFTMRRGHALVSVKVSNPQQLREAALLLQRQYLPDATLAIGGGQGGHLLRDMVKDGLNRSPAGHKVFDGALVMMTGAGEQFPFTYGPAKDPVSGRTDGIFARCSATATCPKLIHLDSTNDFWQARAALVATGGTSRDIAMPDAVRAYLISSTQHFYADRPVQADCRHPNNPARQSPVVRVMLDHLVAWTRGGKAPPPSRYPLLADSMLTKADPDSVGFPDLRALGISHPEGLGGQGPYPLLVPMADVDGHDIAGIRLPEIEVPLATHAGWNLRRGRANPPPLCGPNGLLVPFSATPRKGDPRRAISQRYPSRIEYAKAVALSARALRDQGLLLQEDVDRYIERARRETRVP